MDTQAKRQAKYEREALRDGTAVRTPHGVLLKVLAEDIKCRAERAAAVPMERSHCGVLGPVRTPMARARKHHRDAMKNRPRRDYVSFKAWVRSMGVAA